jgi:adenine deaminase
MVGSGTRVLDVPGRVLVPGCIDPHVHPAHLITPSAFARHILALGTTTVFDDTLQIWALGGLAGFRVVADALARSPLKFFWMIRVHAQSRILDEERRFARAHLARALAHPWVVAAGEVTRWPDVQAGKPELMARLDLARRRGRRVEGHTAGGRHRHRG